jgi:hypothetical protein
MVADPPVLSSLGKDSAGDSYKLLPLVARLFSVRPWKPRGIAQQLEKPEPVLKVGDDLPDSRHHGLGHRLPRSRDTFAYLRPLGWCFRAQRRQLPFVGSSHLSIQQLSDQNVQKWGRWLR